MLQNSDPAPTTAAETRVSTHALTEALASLDARKTREAFARVGTVTLAEGLHDTGVEATPTEVYAEIESLREADAVQEGVKRRQRRLKLVLKAEVVSALLCFLVLFGFQRTLYNPAWQQARQATLSPALPQSNPSLFTPPLTAFRPQPEEFKRLLGLTTGPDPQYIIHAVHQFSYYTGIPEGTMPRVEASADRPLYPLY